MSFAAIRSFFVVGLLCLLAGCHRATPAVAKSAAPSVVAKEDELITVELTEAAEKRLGIQTARIEIHSIPRQRIFGGELALPTNATVIVSAPVTGRLQSPANRQVPQPGTAVVEKQPVLALLPVLSPAEKIALATQIADAEGQVQQARSQVEANRIELKRAEQQLEKGSGTGKVVDDAKAKLILSEKTLDNAVSRKTVLGDVRFDGGSSGDQIPIPIEAPQSGILRAMHALPDEFVMGGAQLFEVMKTDIIWIRVPVYVGEYDEIATDQPAELGELAGRPGQQRVKVQPITAPPTATALSSTIDLYYQVSNSDGKLRPNQRVSVQLPLKGTVEQPVVPWSAVIQDIYGGSWVYEKTAEHKFVRRRVQVKLVVDSRAVLDHGPKVGTDIVIAGVAEMFGTEFGFAK
jgi:membrane fusion protein, heavy metal efflux system